MTALLLMTGHWFLTFGVRRNKTIPVRRNKTIPVRRNKTIPVRRG